MSSPTIIQHFSTATNYNAENGFNGSTNTPGGTPNPGNPFHISWMHPTIAGNCLIVEVSGNNATSPSVTDDKSNVYALAKTVTNGTTRTSIFSCFNCVAGAIRIVVSFNANTYYVHLSGTEIAFATGINSSSALNAGGSATVSAGTLTNVPAGSMLLMFGYDTANIGQTATNNLTTYSAGSGFELLSTEIWLGTFSQFSTSLSGTVTPTATLNGGNTDNYNAVVLVLTAGAQGALPPPGIRILRSQGIFASRVQKNVQFPCRGNLVYATSSFNTGLTGWTFPAGWNVITSNTLGAWIAGTNNPNFTVAIGGLLSGPQVECTSMRMYDIAGASSSPFDKDSLNNSLVLNVTTIPQDVSFISITPTTSNGLLIATLAINIVNITQHSTQTATIADNCWYGNVYPGDTMENVDGYGHILNSVANTQYTFDWALLSDNYPPLNHSLPVNNENIFGIAAAFKAATFSESSNLTSITTVGPSITDYNGNAWAITSGGQVSLNGSTANTGFTSGVSEIAYVGRVVWQFNGTSWFSFAPNGILSVGPTSSPLIGVVVGKQYFVTPTGTGNGSNWSTNAGAYAATVNGASPGDVIWLAGGNYTGVIITAAGTSGNPITIRRITAASGAAVTTSITGWSSGLDAQVTISGNWSIPAFFNIDGNKWFPPGFPQVFGIIITAPHGFIAIDARSGNNTIRNVEVSGPGFNFDTLETNAIQLGSNSLVSGCKLHDMDAPIHTFQPCSNTIVEYTAIYNVSSQDIFVQPNPHPDLAYNAGGTINFIFRYCVFANVVSEGVFYDNQNAGSVMVFYGNLFYQGASQGFGCVPIEYQNSSTFGSVFLYNNTFVDWSKSNNIGGPGSYATIGAGSVIQNNMFVNCTSNWIAGPANTGSTPTLPVPVQRFNGYVNTTAIGTNASVGANPFAPNPISPAVAWVLGSGVAPATNVWPGTNQPGPTGYDATIHIPSFAIASSNGSWAIGAASVAGLPTTLAGVPVALNTDMFGNTGSSLGAFQQANTVIPQPVVPNGYTIAFDQEFNVPGFNINTIISQGLGFGLGTGDKFICHTPSTSDFGSSYFSGPQDASDGISPFRIDSKGYCRIKDWFDTTSSGQTANGVSGHWRSGILSTLDGSDHGFVLANGFYTCCCWVPRAGGTWPSFWMETQNTFTKSRTTNAVEIDVFEIYGDQVFSGGSGGTGFLTIAHQTVQDWTPTGSHVTATQALAATVTNPSTGTPLDLSLGWHIFSVLINGTAITFYIDNVQTFTATMPPSGVNQPFYMMVDLAMGGGWAINPSPPPSANADVAPNGTTYQEMAIAYIRAYAVGLLPLSGAAQIHAKNSGVLKSVSTTIASQGCRNVKFPSGAGGFAQYPGQSGGNGVAAVGDYNPATGVGTDDTQAFLDAFNAGRNMSNQTDNVTNVAVYVPPGNYLVRHQIITWGSMQFFGEPSNPPTIYLKANSIVNPPPPDGMNNPGLPLSFICVRGGTFQNAYSTFWNSNSGCDPSGGNACPSGTIPGRSNNNNFSDFIQNINFTVLAGNTAVAAVLEWSCAQGTGLRNVVLTGTSTQTYCLWTRPGLNGEAGGGGILQNITCNGVGIATVQDSVFERTMRGCTFNGDFISRGGNNVMCLIACTFNGNVTFQNNPLVTIDDGVFASGKQFTTPGNPNIHLENCTFGSANSNPSFPAGLLPQYTSGSILYNPSKVNNPGTISGSDAQLQSNTVVRSGTFYNPPFPFPNSTAVSIKSFGSVAPWDSALISAFNSGATDVYFPPGSYSFNNTITLGPFSATIPRRLFGHSNGDAQINGTSNPVIHVIGRGAGAVALIGLGINRSGGSGPTILWDGDQTSVIMDIGFGGIAWPGPFVFFQSGGCFLEAGNINTGNAQSVQQYFNITSTDPLYFIGIDPQHSGSTPIVMTNAQNVTYREGTWEMLVGNQMGNAFTITGCNKIDLGGIVFADRNGNYSSTGAAANVGFGITNSNVSIWPFQMNACRTAMLDDTTAGFTTGGDGGGGFITVNGYIIPSIVTNSAPSVSATGATNVGLTTATLNGSVLSVNGNPVTSDRFVWGPENSPPPQTYPNSVTATVTQGAPVSTTLNGLTTSQRYHYQFRATNLSGEGISGDSLFIPSPPPPLIQVAGSTTAASNTTVSQAFSNKQVAGNRNIVVISFNIGPTVISVTDTQLNSYTQVSPLVAGGTDAQTIWTCSPTKADATTPNSIAVNLSAASTFISLRIAEYHGLGGLDVHSERSGTGTIASLAGTVATTNVLDILVIGVVSNTGVSGVDASSPFTERFNGSPSGGNDLQDYYAAATLTPSGATDLTSSGNWVINMVAFLPASSVTPPGVPVVTVGAPTSNQVPLTWPAVSDTGAGQLGNTATQLTYDIWRKIGAGGTFTFLITRTGTAGTNSYTDGSLLPGVAYYYEILSRDTGNNTSAFSLVVNTTTIQALQVTGRFRANIRGTLTGGVVVAVPVYVQGVASGMDRFSVTTLHISFPNNTGSGNLLILGIHFNNSGTISSITDDAGNTWTLGPSANNVATGKRINLYYVTNAPATQSVVITFAGLSTGGVIGYPKAVLREFVFAGAPDGTAVGNSTSRTAGTITTTLPGDLIYQWGIDFADTTTGGGAYNGLTLTPGANFIALSADRQIGSFEQYQIQGSAGNITPNFTTGGAAVWGSVAIAFRAVSTGTVPGNTIRIVSIQHTIIVAPLSQGRTATSIIQFPSSGNLLAALLNSADVTITGITDSKGNAWRNAVSQTTNNVIQQLWYAPAAITGSNLDNLTVALTGTSVGDVMFVLYDIINASQTPLGATTALFGTKAANTGNFTTVSLTPVSAGALIISGASVTNETVNDVVGAAYFNDGVWNAFDFNDTANGGTGTSPLDEDNAYSHIYLAARAVVTFTYTFNNETFTLGNWGGVAAEFETAGAIPALAPIQSAMSEPQTAQTVVTALYSSPQNQGDLNVVAIGWGDPTTSISTVKDTLGNVYTAVGTAFRDPVGSLSQQIWYCTNIKAAAAGANTVTVTFPTLVNFPDLRISQFTGAALINPLDGSASAAGTATTASSGSFTTSNGNNLIYGAGYTVGSFTGPGAGFSQLDAGNPDGDISQYEVVLTAGSYAATAPGSGNWIMQAVAFKAGVAVVVVHLVGSNTFRVTSSAHLAATKKLAITSNPFDANNSALLTVARPLAELNRWRLSATANATIKRILSAQVLIDVNSSALLFKPFQARCTFSLRNSAKISVLGVQGGYFESSASSSSAAAAYTRPQTSGNTNIICVFWSAAQASTNVSTITDDAGNVYTLIRMINSPFVQPHEAIYYCLNIVNWIAGNTVTVNFNNTTTTQVVIVAEYAGFTALDASIAAGGNGTLANSFSLTTSQDSDELIAFVTASGDSYSSPGSGFSEGIITPVFQAALLDKKAGVAGFYAATANLSPSNDFRIILAAFNTFTISKLASVSPVVHAHNSGTLAVIKALVGTSNPFDANIHAALTRLGGASGGTCLATCLIDVNSSAQLSASKLLLGVGKFKGIITAQLYQTRSLEASVLIDVNSSARLIAIRSVVATCHPRLVATSVLTNTSQPLVFMAGINVIRASIAARVAALKPLIGTSNPFDANIHASLTRTSGSSGGVLVGTNNPVDFINSASLAVRRILVSNAQFKGSVSAILTRTGGSTGGSLFGLNAPFSVSSFAMLTRGSGLFGGTLVGVNGHFSANSFAAISVRKPLAASTKAFANHLAAILVTRQMAGSGIFTVRSTSNLTVGHPVSALNATCSFKVVSVPILTVVAQQISLVVICQIKGTNSSKLGAAKLLFGSANPFDANIHAALTRTGGASGGICLATVSVRFSNGATLALPKLLLVQCRPREIITANILVTKALVGTNNPFDANNRASLGVGSNPPLALAASATIRVNCAAIVAARKIMIGSCRFSGINHADLSRGSGLFGGTLVGSANPFDANIHATLTRSAGSTGGTLLATCQAQVKVAASITSVRKLSGKCTIHSVVSPLLLVTSSGVTYYCTDLLFDFLLRGVDDGFPVTLYVGLMTTTPSDAGQGTELTTSQIGGYARFPIPCSVFNWTTPINGKSVNNIKIDFGTPSSGSIIVPYWGVWGSPTGNDMLMWGVLLPPALVQAGVPYSFAAGSLSVRGV